MKYYYTTASNQPAGPVTLEELRQLLTRGEIHLATHVVPVGGTTWQPFSTLLSGTTPPQATPSAASTAAAPSASASAPASASPTSTFKKLPSVLSNLIGKLLELVRGALTPKRLTALFGFGSATGQLLVLIGGALTLLVAIVHAIRYSAPGAFLHGLGAVLLIAILQYVSTRFLDSCALIVKKSPTRVASVAVLDCFALLLLVVGIVTLINGIYFSIRLADIDPLIPSLVVSLVLAAAAGVALHPQLAVVDQAESTAGEEAIGLVSFFAKAGLVLMPLSFFLFAAAGVITLFFELFGKSLSAAQAFVIIPLPAGIAGGNGVGLIVAACLFPVLNYIGFLFYYLLLDVLRAILVVPSKLDQLRR